MLLLICLLFVVIILLVLAVLLVSTPKRLDIPGPPQLPIIGNFHTLMQHNGKRLELFKQWTEDYGDVVHFANFSRNVILVNDPACIQHFLQNNFNNFIRFPQNPRFETLFGEGIFHSNGEAWKLHRETARPMFKSDSIEKMGEVFSERAHVVLEIVSNLKPQEPIDVQNLFMRYTLDSIGQIGFGFDIGSLRNPEKCEFANHFDSAQQIIDSAAGNPILKYVPNPTFERNIAYLNKFVYDIIERRKKEGDYENKPDLLSRYMCIRNEEGNQLSDSYFRDAVLNFFIAGRDTTGILLTWTFYLLSLNQDIQERLRQEIKESEKEFGETYDSKRRLKEMKLLHNVLRETLRLYPPVPADGRTAVADDVLPTGHKIPAGTGMFYSAWALHRSKKYWGEDAEEFKPDRWETVNPHAFMFIPFHGGPQTCLGQNMAYKEAKIMTCMLLRKFTVTLDKTHPVRPRKSIVLPADQGVKVFFTPL